MTAVVESKATEKNTGYLDKARLFGGYDLKVQSHDSQLCDQVNGFHDRSGGLEFSTQTMSHSSRDPRPIYCSAAAGEPTLRNRSLLSADIGGLNRLDQKREKVVLIPGCCWLKGGDTGGRRFLYCVK